MKRLSGSRCTWTGWSPMSRNLDAVKTGILWAVMAPGLIVLFPLFFAAELYKSVRDSKEDDTTHHEGAAHV